MAIGSLHIIFCPIFLPYSLATSSLATSIKVDAPPYLNIMATLYFAQIFCLFLALKLTQHVIAIESIMTTPYFAQFFAFLALKLIHLLPPILPKFFALFSIRIDSLTLKVMTTPYHSAV